MSEESSADEGVIIVHGPEWRSDGKHNTPSFSIVIYIYVMFTCLCTVLNRFLQELDKRFVNMHKDTKKHVPERKERIIGTGLSSPPPLNSPKWTVSKDWLKGM